MKNPWIYISSLTALIFKDRRCLPIKMYQEISVTRNYRCKRTINTWTLHRNCSESKIKLWGISRRSAKLRFYRTLSLAVRAFLNSTIMLKRRKIFRNRVMISLIALEIKQIQSRIPAFSTEIHQSKWLTNHSMKSQSQEKSL